MAAAGSIRASARPRYLRFCRRLGRNSPLFSFLNRVVTATMPKLSRPAQQHDDKFNKKGYGDIVKQKNGYIEGEKVAQQTD
jgi:hypothetical protein